MTRQPVRLYALIDDDDEVERTCACEGYCGSNCSAPPLVFECRSDARDYARDTNASFPDLPRLRVVVFDRRR